MAESRDAPETDAQPQPFDAKKLEPAKKRKHRGSTPPPLSSAKNGTASGLASLPKRPNTDASRGPRNSNTTAANDNDLLPQPYDARQLQPVKRRPRSPSPSSSSQPRQLKRPGQRARISEAEREHLRQRAAERERAALDPRASGAGAAANERAAINDVVRAHYNAQPERGRDWRRTDSRIKGLRAFNNWVKSCVIQKFAADEDDGDRHRRPELLVLDMGCGKGGDLGKWAQAPQSVGLYVGLDPAEVSIEQARERYRSMGRGGGGGGGARGGRGGFGHRQRAVFEARFEVKDCYAESIGDVDIVRQVGFETSPGLSRGGRGFDVVSMMFCMHYAFETEQKARCMLQNVAGALKKGGRLIGCIPNSDVIGERVRQFNARAAGPRRTAEAGTVTGTGKQQEGSADADGGALLANGGPVDDGEVEEGEAEETAEWGNDIYRVRFPGRTPDDGIFRPPFGWKYNFYLAEAVEQVPEYVVPWEAFRALAEDYNLELQYHKSFRDVWETEKDDHVLGPLSERMGVRERHGGRLLVSPEEMEAAHFYVAFCFYKV